MDKFVVKRPRGAAPLPSSSGGKVLRQATIESLKCVVVVEDIRRLKAKLKLGSTPKDEMLQSLDELGKKIPPRHVMLDTKIGRVVNKLRKHKDEDIRKAARKIYIKWRSHFQDLLDRPQIEVQCDAKTEKMRSSGRRFLTEALMLEKNNKLPEVIERETYHQFRNFANHEYRRTMRNLVFTLKHHEEVRAKVISGETTVSDFVKQYKKS